MTFSYIDDTKWEKSIQYVLWTSNERHSIEGKYTKMEEWELKEEEDLLSPPETYPNRYNMCNVRMAVIWLSAENNKSIFHWNYYFLHVYRSRNPECMQYFAGLGWLNLIHYLHHLVRIQYMESGKNIHIHFVFRWHLMFRIFFQ